MGIVDKVMGGLREKEQRELIHTENESRHETGPAALALGKPSEYTVDDRIGGTHTREVKDAVVHEAISRHAHHEVTPIVNREREETEIHQKVQPVLDNREEHTHHQHVAPHVSRNIQEDITEDHAVKYRSQGYHQNERTVGEQTHSTSVNAPIVREHVNRHIIEEIQPVIQRQTQQVEHHHTTQQINEVHVKAPVVHTTTVNAPISIEEFAGKAANLAIDAKNTLTGHSHGTHEHGLGRSGTTTTTGTTGSNYGSRGVGSGLTNETSTGLHGHQHTSSTGSTGSAIRNEANNLRNSSEHNRTGNFGEVTSTGDRNAYTSTGATGDRNAYTSTGATGDRTSTGSNHLSLADKAKAAVGLAPSAEKRA